jgi:hypothetical protein
MEAGGIVELKRRKAALAAKVGEAAAKARELEAMQELPGTYPPSEE